MIDVTHMVNTYVWTIIAVKFIPWIPILQFAFLSFALGVGMLCLQTWKQRHLSLWTVKIDYQLCPRKTLSELSQHDDQSVLRMVQYCKYTINQFWYLSHVCFMRLSNVNIQSSNGTIIKCDVASQINQTRSILYTIFFL